MGRRTTLLDLVKVGLLEPGEELKCKPYKDGESYRGRLTERGTISFQREDFKTPSAWAKRLAGSERDGWSYIYARDTKLDVFRRRFEEGQSNQEGGSRPTEGATTTLKDVRKSSKSEDAPDSRSARTPTPALPSEDSEADDEFSEKLLDRIMQLSPDQFERLVGEFLEAKGFDDVKVTTRKTHDGGIDGRCRIPFVKLTVAFQAKKWKNDIGVSPVRELAGVVANENFDRGVFVTTSRFTAGAKEEYDGPQSRIQLVDGDCLVRELIKMKLGVNVIPVTRYELNDEFFENL